jgi:hypothetical protein
MRTCLRIAFCSMLVGSMLALGAASTPAAATTYTRTVRYGPFTIPGATASGPGMIENQLRLAVQRPCLDCYITSFTPDLVFADGTRATMDRGAMLHHVVFGNQFRTDATCGGSWLGLLGERFFASGDERTVAAFPSGYGYRVRWYDSWNMLAELMNMSIDPLTVYVQVTYTVRPSWESVRSVRPVWLDIDQCGDSEYSIPTGLSEETWSWNLNVPGKIVTMLGHQHAHGVYIEAVNDSEGGSSICRSDATMEDHHITNMTSCVGDPVAIVQGGQTVTIHSVYDSPHAADDVMGIMLAYIAD